MNTYKLTQKIAISGIVMALYIVMMYFLGSFAFGAVQVRLATSLYALSAGFPFLILPLALSNMLCNLLFGGFGLIDAAGGLAAGLVTSTAVRLIKKHIGNDYLIALPIVFGPGLIVPIYLSSFVNVPYVPLAVSVCLGQVIPAVLGVLIVKNMDIIFKKGGAGLWN